MRKDKIFAVLDYIHAALYFVLAVMEFISRENGSVAHGFIWLSIGNIWLNLAGQNIGKKEQNVK